MPMSQLLVSRSGQFYFLSYKLGDFLVQLYKGMYHIISPQTQILYLQEPQVCVLIAGPERGRRESSEAER